MTWASIIKAENVFFYPTMPRLSCYMSQLFVCLCNDLARVLTIGVLVSIMDLTYRDRPPSYANATHAKSIIGRPKLNNLDWKIIIYSTKSKNVNYNIVSIRI